MAAGVVGVISDTHGLMRGEALRALEGVDLIIHAGDVGKPEVLEALARVAPVHAVRGNIDTGAWADALPDTRVVEVEGARLFVLHNIAGLEASLAPEAPARFRVVIFGHSHKAGQETRNGVLYLNPGSAGPRRFRLPVTVARMIVEGGDPRAEIVSLDV